jgi:signal transduction histidine kinase
MDELRLIQAWLIATLGGVVGLGFFYVRRVEAGSAARLWAWAWLAFFVSLLVSVSETASANMISHATGTLFPTLLLAGSLAFAERRVPPWLIPAGLAIGAVRGLARVWGAEWISLAGVYAVEAPLDLMAAWVLFQAARSRQRTPAVAALAALHAGFAVLEITNTIFLNPGGGSSFGYFTLGGLATLVLALTQLLALIERVRIVHIHDLELLRRIAQSGLAGGDPRSVVELAFGEIRQRLRLDAGAVWMLRADGFQLECVHYFGTSDDMPEDLRSSSLERPLPKRTLSTGEPVYFDDIMALPNLPIHGWYAEQGIRSGALHPLRRGDEWLGILVVGRKTVKPFAPADQRIMNIAVEELCLALDHVRAVNRLDAERRVLSSVVRTSPTGILVTDAGGDVQILNETFAHHLGERESEPWIGKRIESLAGGIASRFADPEEFARAFLDLNHVAPTFTTPVTLTGSDARELLIFSAPIIGRGEDVEGRVWVTRDVSEEHRLQEELRQSQKMETLGTLAGGVAHDFNNQLAAILGNVRMLLTESEDDPVDPEEARESLVDIERAADHCADLTRSLLAFARSTPLSMGAIRPDWVVDQVSALLRSLLPSTIRFDVRMSSDLPSVFADATQLQQILINLIVNARDAVSQDGRIYLEVKSREVVVTPSDEVRPGGYVEFSVTDDGAGMDAATRRRAFDPFFTTKGVSEGTGLGLAVVYGAARAHFGWVELESTPGRGSSFRVLIPEASEQPTDSSPELPPEPASGVETILVCEDEDKLRRLMTRLLEQRGFEVIEATNGREAVERFEAARDRIQAVLLDVTMPELDGIGALERMREIEPCVPALLMSGLVEVDLSALDPQRTAYLAKPYDLEEVARTIRSLLEQG